MNVRKLKKLRKKFTRYLKAREETRKNAENLADMEKAYETIMRHASAPPMDIETHVDSETFDRLQKRVENTWSVLGQDDAYWSVITFDKFRKDVLEDHRDAFFQMGDGNIAWVEAALNRVGTTLTDLETAMDFGCGVGRLSLPLAERVGHVLGVDISAAHLREAKSNIETFDRQNIETRKIGSVKEIQDLGSFDLVISIIVLQHNPPPVMREILKALCARVRSGGFLYIQVPTYRPGYRYIAADDLMEEAENMEMHVLPQHVFLETIQDAGLTVLEVMEDSATGCLEYRSQVVLSRKK